MKFVLVHFATAKEEWSDLANGLYAEKISHFVDFEIVALKTKKASRGDEKSKLREEAEVLREYLKDSDLFVVFDERGQSLASEKFADQIRRLQESGKKRVVFAIGGAYGIEESLRKEAAVRLSLAPFVMNHLVAELVALEQIYRSFTILKGLPYHNR